MSRSFPTDSVGLVTPQRIKINEPLELACGQVLESHELVYETYGELNDERSNAILICHKAAHFCLNRTLKDFLQ